MESWLLNFTTEAIDAPNSEDIKYDIKAAELVKKWRGHFHDHLHDHLELFPLL